MQCPICKSLLTETIETRKHSITSDLQMIKQSIITEICHNCGNIFNAEGSRNKILDFYKNSYNLLDFSFSAETLVYEKKKYATLSDWRIEHLMNNMPNKTNGKILDIGCGKGNFLYKFQKLNPTWKLFGIESSKSLLSFAKENLPQANFISSLYKQNQFNQKFDLIVALTVLEHLEDPVQFLQNVYEDLTNDGVVCFDVPNFKSNPADLFVYDHLSHFTRETLTNLLHISGFKILKIVEDSDKIPLLIICSKSNNKKLHTNHYTLTKEILSKHIQFNEEQFCIFEQVNEKYDKIGVVGNGISFWAGIQNTKLDQSKIMGIYDENETIINTKISNIPIKDLQMISKDHIPLIFCLSPCYMENILKKISKYNPLMFLPKNYNYYKSFFN